MRIMKSLYAVRNRALFDAHHHTLGFTVRCIVTTCRAVVLPRFGGPDVLELRSNVNVPDLKPNEVLVRARAVSINPLDTRMRSGYGRSIFEPLLPIILGRDISGEVAAVGASVRSLTIGQDVFGALHPTAVRGTYADYAILSEDELTLKPDSITHVEASAIPFAALTAWRALKSTARIRERVVSLCMSPINDSFMSGLLDHSVRIWDLHVNACQGSISPPIDSCKTSITADLLHRRGSSSVFFIAIFLKYDFYRSILMRHFTDVKCLVMIQCNN